MERLHMYANALVILLITSITYYLIQHRPRKSVSKCPISVNYHFTRKCNYSCGFCFHTAKTSHILPISDAKRDLLLLLKEAGMRKINFAGGEPFLYPKFLGEMIDYCKSDLHLESISIVTNGSKVSESFMLKHGKNIDIIAVSSDSFNEGINVEIGRGNGSHLNHLDQISLWRREYGVKFKINTVVCKLNYLSNMNDEISRLQPFRWKCFQVLMVSGENDSEDTLRDVGKFMVTDEHLQMFCKRHENQKSFVAEPTKLMQSSYLLLDEYMRFLDGGDKKATTGSILDVGVAEALRSVYWDEKGLKERGGIFDWSRDGGKGEGEGCGGKGGDGELEW